MTATKQQPIAGYRISDPSDPTIKPWLSDTPDDNGYTSEPLYAGAAPAAVAGPAWDKTRHYLAIVMMGFAGNPSRSLEVAEIVLDAATEPGAPMAYLRGAQAAPALEAPAAPVDDRAEFEKWARQQSWIKDCQRYDDGRYGHYETEKAWATWQARAALAAAPQAPAAPILGDAERLAAARQAPAAPVGDYTLVDEGGPSELAGAQAQFSIERADGTTLAWVNGDKTVANELMRAIGAAPAGPVLGRSAAQAVQALQEMWDDLEKSGSPRVNARAMRYYSDALSTVEQALLAAPGAPAVDAPALGEWVATLEVDSEGGLDYETVPPCTLPPGCYRLYRAAQAKEGGAA